jgi:3,4-dihydroxy 2-butanone 4-phosphate synthase/GTP cyclohydrolase II
MIRHSSGFVCAALGDSDADRLDLPLMVAGANQVDPAIGDELFTVSVDAIDGVTTGISGADRARTLRALADSHSVADHFTRPGHVVPVRSHPLGVLARGGAAEVVTDLARFAGLRNVGTYAALVSPVDETRNADGQEARRFAADHATSWVSADDVLRYRHVVESHVRLDFTDHTDSHIGRLQVCGYTSTASGSDYFVYRYGRPDEAVEPFVFEFESRVGNHASIDPVMTAALNEMYLAGDGILIVSTFVAPGQSTEQNRAADVAQIVREQGISAPAILAPNVALQDALNDLGIEFSPTRAHHPLLAHPTQSPMIEQRIVCGVVCRGDQRGRELGYPTVNLALPDDSSAMAGDGVWAGRCVLADGRTVAAAVSIGRRPTFYGRAGVRLLEAHLLDFSGDLYDQNVTVRLDHWIRGQTSFSSKEELIEALAGDVLATRSLVATD